MNLDELKVEMAKMKKGQMIDISHEVYSDLFPPGEPDENARAACYDFAKANGCRIENKPSKQQVWFIKDA